MSKKAVIFGTASFAEVVHFYLTHDSDYEVVGFAASADSIIETSLLGLPIVPYEQLGTTFPPDKYHMFIAIGYAKLNKIREKFFLDAKSKGYTMLSYICSKATHWDGLKIGENVFIFEDNTIQPFVSIGDGTILWSGNHIGHHSTLGKHCFISSHVVISGHCNIGSHCFIGVNATIADSVKIGNSNLIGPGSLIQKNTGDDDVYFAERAKKHARDSGRFFQ